MKTDLNFTFTEFAYVLTANITGREGRFGTSVSVIGVFVSVKGANQAKIDYMNKLENIKLNQCTFTITKIKVCQIDEKIVASIYE